MRTYHYGPATIKVDDKIDWLDKGLIYLIRHGSQAYGTATPTSDLDVKGIIVAPRSYYSGFLHMGFKQMEGHGPDYVLYELRRYMQLAVETNPNLIEMIWADPSDYIYVNPVMHHLIDHKDLFISKKVRASFSGYAHNQLHRLRNHRTWLMNPPTHKPTRAEFSLPELATINHEQILAAEHLIEKGFTYDINFQDLVSREKKYRIASQHWDQYQNWKTTRNPARHALEAKYGYDTKHGMHLVRLIRMCREILETGKVLVRRPDAEELLDIRRGAWSYEQIVEWADRQETEIDALYATSTLPNDPPRSRLDELCQFVVEHASY